MKKNIAAALAAATLTLGVAAPASAVAYDAYGDSKTTVSAASISIKGSAWKGAGTNGSAWKGATTSGNTWSSVGTNGNTWSSVGGV